MPSYIHSYTSSITYMSFKPAQHAKPLLAIPPQDKHLKESLSRQSAENAFSSISYSRRENDPELTFDFQLAGHRSFTQSILGPAGVDAAIKAGRFANLEWADSLAVDLPVFGIVPYNHLIFQPLDLRLQRTDEQNELFLTDVTTDNSKVISDGTVLHAL